jgi:hypothetical protein
VSEAPRTIGWREWVLLPELSEEPIRAKVDTGARTSSLHAYDVVELDRDGERWVRFRFRPGDAAHDLEVEAEARLLEHRKVTASSGHSELRPVVAALIEIDGQRFEIELTLTRRDTMGFRMLLGRRALRGRFLVDPKRSFRTSESQRMRKLARDVRGGRGG